MSHQQESRAVWEEVSALLPDEREKRLAYLLFHCGLKAREVVRICPQEFSDLQEVYVLQQHIFACLIQMQENGIHTSITR